MNHKREIPARLPLRGACDSVRGFRGCWFVSVDGVAVEAMTGGQIIDGLKRGEFSLATPVTREGMDGWAPISSVPSLASSTLLFRGARNDPGRASRPVLLDALPRSEDEPLGTDGPKPRRMTGLAYRARDYLSAFFAASSIASLFRL